MIGAAHPERTFNRNRLAQVYYPTISITMLNKNAQYLILPLILILVAWVYMRYLGDSPRDLVDKKVLTIESFLMASLIFVAVFV
jgi:hypothetical protein